MWYVINVMTHEVFSWSVARTVVTWHDTYGGSQILQVKQHWHRLVLGWVTACACWRVELGRSIYIYLFISYLVSTPKQYWTIHSKQIVQTSGIQIGYPLHLKSNILSIILSSHLFITFRYQILFMASMFQFFPVNWAARVAMLVGCQGIPPPRTW